MHLDVVALRDFYFGTQLGLHTREVLNAQISRIWPDVRGLAVIGFGFAPPALQFLEWASRRICLMPERQGVMAWPCTSTNISVLVSESMWPIPTAFVERVVFLHGLETSENASSVLDECWRVLMPEGRVLFIVPNRAGLWARRDITPFGYGRPYSVSQLENYLVAHRFEPMRRASALYAPPGRGGSVKKTAGILERLGDRSPFKIGAGIHLVEARKRMFSQSRPGITETVKSKLVILTGVGVPGPKPASGRALSSEVGERFSNHST